PRRVERLLLQDEVVRADLWAALVVTNADVIQMHVAAPGGLSSDQRPAADRALRQAAEEVGGLQIRAARVAPQPPPWPPQIGRPHDRKPALHHSPQVRRNDAHL